MSPAESWVIVCTLPRIKAYHDVCFMDYSFLWERYMIPKIYQQSKCKANQTSLSILSRLYDKSAVSTACVGQR